MPGLIQETPFKTITVKELHPTFGAEIEGVDFDNLTDEQFSEVKAALTKVRPQPHASTNTYPSLFPPPPPTQTDSITLYIN